MGKHLCLLLVVFLLIGFAQLSYAQSDNNLVYSAADEPFSFLYPGIYTLQRLDSGVVELTNQDSPLSVLIYSPATLTTQGVAAATAEATMSLLVEDMSITPGELSTFTVGENTTRQLLYREANKKAGFLLVVELPDDTLAALNIRWNSANSDPEQEQILHYIAGTMLNAPRDESFVPTPTAQPSPQPAATPIPEKAPPALSQLTSDRLDWQAIVAELETGEMIPSGGRLIFQEDYAFFSGQGNWYTPLAARSSVDDFIMAGTLNFQHDGSMDDECALMSRIHVINELAEGYLEVGFEATGTLYLRDRHADTTEDFYRLRRGISINEPHHILYIVRGETIMIYLNGEFVTQRQNLEPRSGPFGVSLWARLPNAQCTGQDIWAYAIPHVIPGECHVEVTGSINQRQGPSTTTATAGQLVASDHPAVIGQTTGDQGFVWWQLADESWVRSDVVQVVGDCNTVPEVTIP